jgi:ferredoxin/flavodoxin---NADP+ reductase
MDVRDVAVVGGGPAGLAAAMYCALRGLSAVLFEAESFGGQLINVYPTKPVSNFPAQEELVSRELAGRLADQASRFGAELREHAPVERVAREGDRFVLRTSEGTTQARALVLAVGLGRFHPRQLGLEDEERYLGRGLTYRLPPLEEVDTQRILVIGGGDTAVDAALSLREVAEVTVVHWSDRLRAFGHSQEKLAASGVDVLLRTRVVRLVGDGRVTGAVVDLDGELAELPADLVLVSVGQVPELRGLEGLQLPFQNTHLPVTTAMETGVPGVFAAGDIVSYEGKIRMIAVAVAEGSTAAASVERFLTQGGLGAAA